MYEPGCLVGCGKNIFGIRNQKYKAVPNISNENARDICLLNGYWPPSIERSKRDLMSHLKGDFFGFPQYCTGLSNEV